MRGEFYRTRRSTPLVDAAQQADLPDPILHLRKPCLRCHSAPEMVLLCLKPGGHFSCSLSVNGQAQVSMSPPCGVLGPNCFRIARKMSLTTGHATFRAKPSRLVGPGGPSCAKDMENPASPAVMSSGEIGPVQTWLRRPGLLLGSSSLKHAWSPTEPALHSRRPEGVGN